MPYDFTEDWAKIIHLEDSKLFVCGGSTKEEATSNVVFSDRAFTVDAESGRIRKLPSMHKCRQAHGVCRVGQYVYACGGLNSGWSVLNHCERFDLELRRWTEDVPALCGRKFSMTTIKVDRTWLYNFGGVSFNYQRNQKNMVVERLDTRRLKDAPRHPEANPKEDDDSSPNMLVTWEEVCIASDVFTSCCQQGVIALTSSSGHPRYREYLIFGGVDSDYTK